MATQEPSTIKYHTNFEYIFTWERRAIKFFTIFQLVLIIILLIGWIVSSTKLSAFSLFLSALAIIAYISLFVIFYLKYLALPIVDEKRRTANKIKNLENESQQVLSTINDLKKDNEIITNQFVLTESKLRGESRNREIQITNQIKNTTQEEKAALQKALILQQAAYLEKQLLLARLLDAPLAGIGPTLKERIRNAGISSAADVDDITLNGISGLGDIKRQELKNWRKYIETKAQRSMPKRLEKETEDKILNEFANIKASLRFKQVDDTNKLEKLLMKRKALLDSLIAENIDDIEREQEVYKDCNNSLDRLKKRMDSYSGVTFIHFLRGCFKNDTYKSNTKRRGVAFTTASIIFLGFIFQGTMAVKSASSIIIASIPKVTPTIANTSIPTITFTLLPTSTLTPSFTATWTFTSTQTKTNTVTKAPTSVLLNIAGATCIPQTSGERGIVVGVVDGDTILVKIKGATYTVRYIGIDAPENGNQTEYYGVQAYSKNLTMVNDKEIFLFKDVLEVDVYGRLLRYVVVGTRFVNYDLVSLGYAYATEYAPDVSCADVFIEAQLAAANELMGLWKPTPVPTVKKSPTITSTPYRINTIPPIIQPTSPSGNCDPSYPTVCIPPPPPDLDCKDIIYRDFRVYPPDPHRFDGDHDGIGCET